MDITTDGFGLMLAFGDLAWVPFTYTMQARYLVQVPVSLSPVAMAGVIAVVGVGFYIFRSANWQKDAFRKNPTAPGVRRTCDCDVYLADIPQLLSFPPCSC